MRNKKEDIKIILIIILIFIGFLALCIWSFNRQSNECDKEMGRTCSLYEIDNQNWKRK